MKFKRKFNSLCATEFGLTANTIRLTMKDIAIQTLRNRRLSALI